MNEAIDFVIYSLLKSKGGEIFVPKIPSFRVIDLANALADNCKLNIIGIRKGEKIHEEMISSNEALNSIDLGKCYAILNEFNYKFYKNYKFLSKDFVYRSDTNKKFLTINNLKKIIRNFLSKNQQY
jgi:FlaA1/EpsC-like NDP-sugar epimerase